jgi:hypothetical protein
MTKNSGREARQNNIAFRMAKMDVNRQFRLITDLLPDVELAGKRHLIFEVTE